MSSTQLPELILIGGGGHCASAIDVIETAGQFRIAGIIDSNRQLQEVCGYPVLGNDNMLAELGKRIKYAFVTTGQVGDASLRIRLIDLVLKSGYTTPTLISPRAYIARHARIGHGSIIMHDAMVNARATVGQHCIINSKALVEHDVVIEDYCHVSTAAVINGGAVIRRASFVGSHATIIENAVSNNDAFIKAGSVFRGTP